MKLSPKTEKFAQLVAKGLNQSEAYRQSYNVRENTKPESIHQNASKLATDTNVTSRIDELRREMVKDNAITLVSIIERLERISAKAENKEDFSPAIKALETMARLSGLEPEKKVALSGEIDIANHSLLERLSEKYNKTQ